MSFDPLQMKLDEKARMLCKPLGCQLTSCLSGKRPGNCWPQMTALNVCLEKKRKEIDEALKEGRGLETL